MRSKAYLGADAAPEALPATDAVLCQHIEILSGDAGDGGLMRIRQFAARADARNLNRRVYPKAVIQAAIDEARKMAQAGAMLCEMRHPDVAQTPNGEKYTHNPERVTARVDDISDVQHDGRIFVTRTILDTPMGRQVADAIRARRPLGISTRFRMRGHPARLDGDSVDVATWMEIHTWDDVENPAVVGAGEPVPLSDSVLSTLSPEPDPATPMKFPKDLRAALAALIVAAAASDAVATARKAYHESLLSADATVQAEERPHAVLLEIDMAKGGYAFADAAPKFVADSLPAPVQAQAPAAGAAGGDSRENADTLSADEQARVRRMLEASDEQTRRQACRAAADSLASAPVYAALEESLRTMILDRAADRALKADDVARIAEEELGHAMKLVSDERLRAQGYVKADGRTVDQGRASVTREAQPWMEGVNRILAATDDYCASANGLVNPHDPDVQARRKRNRHLVIEPMIEGIARATKGFASVDAWMRAEDAFVRGGEKAFGDSMGTLVKDNTTTAQVYNQPTIILAWIYQAFQDMQMAEYAQVFGPGMGSGGAGFERAADGIGSVLRLPVEYWEAPGGYGTQSGTFDAGLLVPENTGIDEGTVRTVWLPFAPVWRRIAGSATADVTRAMFNGPANYGLIARTLFHMAYDKSRRVDKALADEMLLTSDEYAAVAIAGEAYTSGNGTASLNLANNSVYAGGGSITVNLNPAKLANAALAATDVFQTYGANVVGAVRLRTRAVATSAAAGSTYYAGTTWGTDPVLLPRTVKDLTPAGVMTSTTKNPFTVTAPANQVMGYLDANFQIQAIPGIANPTFAVDWENGVLVFNAASGIAGAASAITTAITVSYSYATNFDNFVVNNPTLAAGITVEAYLNGLIRKFDSIRALMGSAPRYRQPNLALMTLNASVNFTGATIFYALNDPKGTELFPSPDRFMERAGISAARHNAPWNGGDRRVLFTQTGATKYGVDTPFEMRGPFPAYDSSGKIVARDIYYGEENSVVCTPQAQDQSGNTINPVSRTLILR